MTFNEPKRLIINSKGKLENKALIHQVNAMKSSSTMAEPFGSPRNIIHSDKKWELLLYGAVLDYCRYRFNIDNGEIIELKLKKITKNKYFGEIDLGNKNIITIENSGLNTNISNIIHEFVHIKQKIKQELKDKGNILLWNDKAIITVQDYKKATREEHNNLPFEMEAIEESKNINDFFDSDFIKNSLGIDASFDFLIKNRS
jgi:hypothetical protein